MTILKDLAVVQETYTDRNGEQKKKWLTIGQIHASNEGREYIVLYPWINLAAIPRKEGDSRLFVSIFEPKVRDEVKPAHEVKPAQTASKAPAKPEPAFDNDSDVPF